MHLIHSVSQHSWNSGALMHLIRSVSQRSWNSGALVLLIYSLPTALRLPLNSRHYLPLFEGYIPLISTSNPLSAPSEGFIPFISHSAYFRPPQMDFSLSFPPTHFQRNLGLPPFPVQQKDHSSNRALRGRLIDHGAHPLSSRLTGLADGFGQRDCPTLPALYSTQQGFTPGMQQPSLTSRLHPLVPPFP